MPTSKSAAKRLRTSAKARDQNRGVKSEMASSRRELLDSIAAGDHPKSDAAFRTYCSLIDKAVKHGTITRNKANRNKSRIHARLGALQAKSA